jgi:hypothetical protein
LILWIEKEGYRRDGKGMNMSYTKNKSVKSERNPLQTSMSSKEATRTIHVSKNTTYTHLLAAVFKKCQSEERTLKEQMI